MRSRRESPSRAAAPSASATGAMAPSIRFARGARSFFAAGRSIRRNCLKLSGVGPAAELGALGIGVVADRPGVGENLQDHLEFIFQVASKQPITLYGHTGLVRPRADRR